MTKGTNTQQLEEIIRGQFVDRAYRTDGSTSWGVVDTVQKILTWHTSQLSQLEESIKENIHTMAHIEGLYRVEQDYIFLSDVIALIQKMKGNGE